MRPQAPVNANGALTFHTCVKTLEARKKLTEEVDSLLFLCYYIIVNRWELLDKEIYGYGKETEGEKSEI